MDLTNRERFLRLMRGELVDRAPFAACFLAWPETLGRWHREGLPEDPTARYNFLKVVGFDFYVHQHKMPVNAFLCPPVEEEILEEDEGTRVVVDGFGTRKRVLKDGISMPEFFSFMVSCRADWEEARKLLDPETPGRFPDEEQWKSFCKESRKLTDPCYAGGFPGGFFGGLRQLFGLEGLAYAFYDDPNLVEDVLDTLCDLWVELYSKALKDVSIDFFVPWEDMCYKAGPMLSPEMFRRYLLPRYQRLTEALHYAGVDIFFVDTDGDPRQLIDFWLEGGVTGLYPWETQMGLDITRVRRDHPELQMMGGIDKHRLSLGRKAIDRELEKIPFMLESGRYLPCLDHSAPPNVSWDDYRYFCERLRDLIERYPPEPLS